MHLTRRGRAVVSMALSVFVIAVVAGVASGAAKKFDCKGGAITIGVAQGKTGGFAFFDNAGYKGFQVGVDEINAKGGVDGCKIKLLFGDTKSDPARAQQVAADLIKKGAQMIKTPSDFDIGVGASLAARSAKVFSFSTEASSVDWPKAVKTHVVMAITTEDQGRAQATFANKKGWKKVYVVTNEAFNFFKAMESIFKDNFKGTLVGRDVVADDATDYSAVVSKIRDASDKPDVIYLNDYFPHVGTFIKQLRDAGVKTSVLGNSTYASPALVQVIGKGRIQNVFYAGQTFYEGPTAPAATRGFVSNYTKRFKSPPENLNAIASYEGAYLLADALRKAGSVDPAKVQAAMGAQKNQKLPTGSTVFSWTNGYTHRTSSVIGFDKAGNAILVDTIKPS